MIYEIQELREKIRSLAETAATPTFDSLEPDPERLQEARFDIDELARVRVQLQADLKVARAERSRLLRVAKQIQTTLSWLDHALVAYIERIGKDGLQTAIGWIASRRASIPRINITVIDERELPDWCWKRELDLSRIRQHFVDTGEVPEGVEISTHHSQYIQMQGGGKHERSE